MNTHKIYDIIGIGIGPFNLGLAAILTDLPELKSLFIEQRPCFDWHPGLLLPTARMQVPYYADLVSPVNPQSPFTFLNFLHKTQRFIKFANQDNAFPLRIEYNRYCQWVAGQLNNLRFNSTCENILYDAPSKLYKVETTGGVFHGKHIVLGTGTAPYVPPCLAELSTDSVIHAGHYLYHKASLLTKKNVSVIGSGQSAAEIFYDLLPYADTLESLAWFTRSNRFHPMDYSRLTTEMTSLDYIDHFYSLGPSMKEQLLVEQQYLYKGINHDLIAAISDALYIREANDGPKNVHLHANADLVKAQVNAATTIAVEFRHREIYQLFTHTTAAIVAATGYAYQVPACIEPLTRYIDWNHHGQYAIHRNYSIDRHNSLFVQNADLHTHGFNSADLGMGPYRNGTILNSILGRNHFDLETGSGFQSFGWP